MKGIVKERLLREEKGFTLSEVMVTMLIMLMVLFSLYSIFDMSIRVFSFGNDKVEAVENARLGLEKMEREIRGAYPYDLTSSPQKRHLFFGTATPTTGTIPSSSQITFGNDLNGNWRVECPSVPSASNPREYITYKLVGNTLRRVNTCDSADTGQPVVEFVQDVDGDSSPLTFTYMNSSGGTPVSEGDIAIVRIQLEVAVDRGIQEQPVTQILTTDVALKNRGE